jgi:hypothetical protein
MVKFSEFRNLDSLASKNNLKVREEKTKGIWVEGATEVYVSSEQEVLDIIRMGTSNRAIAETSMYFTAPRNFSLTPRIFPTRGEFFFLNKFSINVPPEMFPCPPKIFLGDKF